MSKRLVMCLLAFALAATCSVFAQDQNQSSGQQGGERRMGGPGGRGGMMNPQARLDRLSKELNLTKDQQDKIKPILEDEQKQMEELRSSTSSGERPDMSKMRDIRKSHDEQIRAVMTSDQQTKYDEMQKRMMERGPRGGGQGGGTPPPPPQQ